MKNVLPTLTGLMLVACAAVAFDRMSGRWTAPRRLQEAAGRLEQLPTALPNWKSVEVEVDERQLALAEAVGHYSRRFVELGSGGSSLHVMILCGEFGPISVHPPTVCFTGAGLEQVEPVRRRSLESTDQESFGAIYESKFAGQGSLENSKIRTYWAWGTDGEWTAVPNPRVDFAGSPYLYKMYVIIDDGMEPDANGELPEDRFLREFLPQVHDVLSSSGNPVE